MSERQRDALTAQGYQTTPTPPQTQIDLMSTAIFQPKVHIWAKIETDRQEQQETGEKALILE